MLVPQAASTSHIIVWKFKLRPFAAAHSLASNRKAFLLCRKILKPIPVPGTRILAAEEDSGGHIPARFPTRIHILSPNSCSEV